MIIVALQYFVLELTRAAVIAVGQRLSYSRNCWVAMPCRVVCVCVCLVTSGGRFVHVFARKRDSSCTSRRLVQSASSYLNLEQRAVGHIN
jgi:hypothetical protein